VKTKRILSILAAVANATSATYALAQHEAPGQHPPTHEGDPNGAPHATEHAAAHEEGHAAGGDHHGPAPINWTDISDKTRPAFIALAINFGILLAIYYAMGKKGITEGLKKRRIDIGKDIDDARKMLDEAKERAKKYQADLKNADVDAATAKASLVSAGKGEVEHLLNEANEKAERMKRDAERLVEQEKKQLHQDLLTETVQRAVTNAQKILEKNANSEDHARLAQELLAELGRLPAAKRVAAPQSVRPVGGAS
jgi:F-type H+-transporting ATPase subunit b